MTRRDADLPTVDAASLPEPPVPGDDPAVAGILLAAGASERFGSANKLLASREGSDGEPIVRPAARTLAAAGLEPIVAVLGHDAERTRAALEGLPVRTVVNGAPERGQASSVRCGIEAVRSAGGSDDSVLAGDDDPVTDAGAGISAAVVALGDMPTVSPGTVDALVAAHAAGVGTALAPAYEGTRGNPVLFDRGHFDALASLEGDVGGRRLLLEGEESALVAVDDPAVLRDIDTRADLERDRGREQ